jgi:hypothetical protein
MRLHPSHLLLGMLLLAGCVAPAPVMVGANPYPPPPPRREEMVPKPPVTDQLIIWEPGHWDWIGDGYTWREGRYVPLDGHDSHWLDGYWSNQSGTWLWVPAHWM